MWGGEGGFGARDCRRARASLLLREVAKRRVRGVVVRLHLSAMRA